MLCEFPSTHYMLFAMGPPAPGGGAARHAVVERPSTPVRACARGAPSPGGGGSPASLDLRSYSTCRPSSASGTPPSVSVRVCCPVKGSGTGPTATWSQQKE